MIRKIISIDENKCNGCGLCITACHEGALQLVDGKAKLISESYCDGLGNCLPECPTGAIKIEERESAEFDMAAVEKHLEQSKSKESPANTCGCPGIAPKSIKKNLDEDADIAFAQNMQSQLGQWPCQIKLVPVNAPYFNNADVLIAADCTAFAYANIHQKFMKNKITIIGCPKLDDIDYSEKLSSIFKTNKIKSVTVLRMEVPCCGGIVYAVNNALKLSGAQIPLDVITISTEGNII